MVDIGGIMIKLPLVGPAYKMQSQSISCQNCINWYPQTIEYPNGSRVAALMPTPGLKKLFNGEVAATRCLYVLSNGALLVVIGKKLYHSKSTKLDLKEIGLISALGTVRIADNGQVALIVNGTYTYALDLKKLTLTRLSGSTIPRSTHVLFLDGRFVVNKANTGQFYWSDLYSTKVNALSYATAESTPDNITAIVTFNRELWLFGAQSVERYYGTGSSNSPFSRLSGGAMAFGCLAPDSIVSLATGVIWLGVSEFGGNQIVMSGGGIPDRISTHALEEEISSFTKTSDASAYAYQIEGHVFYVISFPSANVTYCFDVSTGLWHQRSFTNAQGLHERHRSQHHAYFNNTHIVGDYRNGKLYQLDNNTFTDDGELILRERTAQAVITDKKLTRFSKLEIVCETGFNLENVQRIDPEPPLIIMCNDETNSVRVAMAAKQSEVPSIAARALSNTNNPMDYFELRIDSEVYPFDRPLPEHIQLEPSFYPRVFLPEGFDWLNAFQFINLNKDSTAKIEFLSKNPELFIFAWDNSTIVNNFSGTHFGACLATNKEVDPEPGFDGPDWFVLNNVTNQDLYIDDVLVATAKDWDTQWDYLTRLQRVFSSKNIDLLFVGEINNNIPAIYLRNEKIASTKISFKKNGYVKGTITSPDENVNTSFVESDDGVTIQLGKQFTEDLIYKPSESNNFFAYQYYSVSDFSKAQAMMQIYINDQLFVTNANDPFYYSKDLERWHGIRAMSKEFYEDPILENINTYVFENMTEKEIKLRFRYFTPLGCQSTKTALNDSANYLERNLCIVLAPRKLVVDVKDRPSYAINLRYEFSRKYPVYLQSDLVVEYNIKSDLKPYVNIEDYFTEQYPTKMCNALCNMDPNYSQFDHVKASSIFVGEFPRKLIKGQEGSGYENRWGAPIESNNQWIYDVWGSNVTVNLNIESEVYGLGGAGGNIVDRLTGNYDLNGQNGFAPISNFDEDVIVNLTVKSTGRMIAGGGGGASFPTGKLKVEFRERHTFENSNEWTEWTDWQFDKITGEFYLFGGTGGLPNGIVGNYNAPNDDFPYALSTISNEYAFTDFLKSKMLDPKYAFDFNNEEMAKFNSGLPGGFAKRSVKSPPDDSDGLPFVINNVIENSGLYQREFKRKWEDLRNDQAMGGLAGKLFQGGKVGKIIVHNGGKILTDDANDLDIEYL